MITIIDYGAGNLRSVVNAVRKLGYRPKVTSNPEDVLNAQAVILPGVGAAV
ncbi:imidazole glycerol phosphate synthase subunit HisH, partial [Chloroflexota bacterium]